MIKKTLLATFTMTALVSSFAVYAADGTTGGDFGGGTINFTGSVTEAPCSIQPGDDNQEINLGQVSQKLLASAGGKGSSIIPITIRLQSCDLSTTNGATAFTKANVIFTGAGIDSANTQKGYLVNSGTATNVSVQLTSLSGAAMDLSNGTPVVTLSPGDGNTIQFGAHIVNSATSGTTVTPGSVKATVTYKLKYS
ncbi:fimbrial protein [Salmonella enterica subsp. enterica serovar Muenchen]|uniref:fimbrial protein n=1 Tax=Salmonella enterica TaxID=28901 RepID=UPI001F10E67E|nr:fimbrial protein [Salmonella enterica]EAW2474340.1 fimbrial protein [Salmonella enterica subsp. enterica]EEJ6214535.1 fimbrial protein [Salmonella enterica]MCH5444667.1 fimbrial protein [Salmonella enterica subsp. enterica serovar Muenchen]